MIAIGILLPDSFLASPNTLTTSAILFPSIDTTNTVSPTNFLRPQPVHAAIDTTTINEAGSRQTVIDEVWTLINKYYIDQTFNNQEVTRPHIPQCEIHSTILL